MTSNSRTVGQEQDWHSLVGWVIDFHARVGLPWGAKMAHFSCSLCLPLNYMLRILLTPLVPPFLSLYPSPRL
jgi:hypothetical protein